MKTAIVIGASSGMGRDLAKVLAAHGYIIEAMARRVHLLEDLRREIKTPFHVQEIDISKVDSAMAILAQTMEKVGDVDLVVISAGTGHLNDKLEWGLEYDAIMTNVTGFTAVANIAIKYFLKRGSGHLVAISSIAALRGGRHSPAYNASKAFETNYLEGLRQKVTKAGLPITITDIRPGFVATEMAKGENIFWAATAHKAASQIYRAIKKRKTVAYVTKRWALIAWILRLMPRFIYDRL